MSKYLYKLKDTFELSEMDMVNSAFWIGFVFASIIWWIF